MITVGSKWSAIDCEFLVTGLLERDDGLWVYYKNVKTGFEYNCLVEAFLNRFKEVTNEHNHR